MKSERMGWKREWINDCKKNKYKKLYTVLSCLSVFTSCTCTCCILICFVFFLLVLSCLLGNCCWFTVCIVVVDLCVLLSYVCLLYYVCIFFSTLNAGLLAISQYSEGPVTGHLDTGFSWFPCAQKQMLRCFPRFQVATTCFSCSSPDLNLLVTNFMFCLHVK